ncbi:hypothetical protein GCM10010174_69050 [Kutzneria viridogrisea]|uniref:EmrB/QacA subfamily drug resistance transporter n=1 Tax=Kutzneria viridogrisea TaxID=47990 RepID=A0ABR6BB54_9PSEU|nr:EmrB/QacA subfamily drug resistance transporter [Kutzneria viridogrisea]
MNGTMSRKAQPVPTETVAVRRVKPGFAILAASVPMFMVSLNNLVVTNALPAIRKDFSAEVSNLQWVVNAYVLAFASLLLTGAALGDRYGRRTVFVIGVVVFSLGSVECALANSLTTLVIARVVQGIGAAAVQPLSLTLLAAAVPERRRSAALGLWGGVNGLGVALGPVVGGAVTEGLAWQWIFWINVPVGLLAVPLVLRFLRNGKGADGGLDIPGMVLITVAVTLTVWAIVRAGEEGWGSTKILSAFLAAFAVFVLFVLWEQQAKNPLLPLRFYRIRAFVMSNLVSLAMFFGVFGSIFFLAQYLQGPLGFSPFQAGLRTLPWTAMPLLVAPLSGLITDRVGGGRLMTLGLALQGVGLAWIALIATADLDYARVVPPLVVAGIGMGLVFGPTSAVVLGAVRKHEHGKASGANNTVREVGGALGVAVLATVFTDFSSEVPVRSPADAAQAFVHGMVPAIWVGVAVVGVGVVAGLFIPRRSLVSAPTVLIAVTAPTVQRTAVAEPGRHRTSAPFRSPLRPALVLVGSLLAAVTATGVVLTANSRDTSQERANAGGQVILGTTTRVPLPSPGSSSVPIPSPSSTSSSRPPTTTPRPTTTTAPPMPSQPSLAEVRAQLLDLVNQARAKAGCRPVVQDARLDRAAQQHSVEMAENGYFSHASPDGTSSVERVREVGYPHPGQENLAHGTSTPAEVMDAWLRGSASRDVIVNCVYVAVGSGVDEGHSLWTQVFGA